MEGKPQEACGQKRVREQAVAVTGEGLASVKKARTAVLPTDVPECPAAVSGCQQKPGSPRAPASKGFAPAAIENPSPCSEGSCGEMVPSSGRGVPPAGQQLLVTAAADFEARSGSPDPALLRQDVSRSALYSQVAEPRGLPPAPLSGFSEENVPEHSVGQNSGAIQRSTRVRGTPPSGGGVESLLLGGWGNAEAGDLREMSRPHLRGQQASPSHSLPAEAAAFPLHSVLPVTVPPAACASNTVPEPGPHPGPDGSLSTNGGPSIGNKAGDVSQLRSRMEADGQREPETVAAVGEALALEISDVCQEVSQGQEQILIRTASGLILSNPRATVSREENTVIVTNTGGSLLRTPKVSMGHPARPYIPGHLKSAWVIQQDPTPGHLKTGFLCGFGG
ncbi:zinc finger protein [Cricetulus griseus]|uniref:Zinc finger protein n=1 Tax=Cricetulus griseus TaxID=10029 RepID=A0A061I100_CRIGR|nr:zinc finger protein [Cricetulus griseus]